MRFSRRCINVPTTLGQWEANEAKQDGVRRPNKEFDGESPLLALRDAGDKDAIGDIARDIGDNDDAGDIDIDGIFPVKKPRKSTTPRFLPSTESTCRCDSSVAVETNRFESAKYMERR